jgi:diguanylate cyclase (GGDEF)-like protein
MSQPHRPPNDSLDLRLPAPAGGRSCRVNGRDGMPEPGSGSIWGWPGRALAMLRACRGVERYVVDSSGKSHHLAWAVGSAGLVSAGMFLLMKRVRLFSWAGRSSAGPVVPGLSTYDSVTGLPTKRLFMTLANQAVARARQTGRKAAILVVELDHFTPDGDRHETVHDNLVYRVQAARLKSALRTTDTVARLADRSFAALVGNIADGSAVAAVAAKMQAVVSLPLIVGGRELFLTSRIGIGLSSSETKDATGLLDLATQAVIQARTEGFVIYGHGVPSVAPTPASTL